MSAVAKASAERSLQRLPTGWTWARLGDICEAINGRAFKSSEWRKSGLPIVRIQNLKNPDEEFNYFSGEIDDRHRVRHGDLLFAWSGTPGTSFGAHIWKGPAAALNQHIFNIKFDPDVLDSRYFCLALNQNVSRYVAQAQGGVGLAHITKSKFLNSFIPLAPKPKQLDLVAEIEKQFSRLDEAVANLKRVKANLTRYKATVLDAAVKGRIGAKGAASDDERPTGWQWRSIGELATVGTGATPARSNAAFYRGGTIPWITSSAVNEPFVDAAEQFVTDEALRQTNLTLYPPGTLLVAMYGEGKTRGKCSELRVAATTNQALAALQVEPAVRPWLKLFLEHNYDNTRRIASGGVQPNLNLGLIRAIGVPLPPPDEQRRIVAKVDSRLSIVREVDAEVDANLKRALALRQAVLARAFHNETPFNHA